MSKVRQNNIIKKEVILPKWINLNTANSDSVVELGSGFCYRLMSVHETVKTKIGIEIWKPYLDKSVCNECIKINGDILNYKTLLEEYNFDTAMLIDILEHFDKKTATDLIVSLKKDFNKIILMIPAGRHEQDTDVFNMGGDYYQTHRSFWYDEDIHKLMFDENILDPVFHSTEYRVKIS